jgi:hypothetical protein
MRVLQIETFPITSDYPKDEMNYHLSQYPAYLVRDIRVDLSKDEYDTIYLLHILYEKEVDKCE